MVFRDAAVARAAILDEIPDAQPVERNADDEFPMLSIHSTDPRDWCKFNPDLEQAQYQGIVQWFTGDPYHDEALVNNALLFIAHRLRRRHDFELI